ncbi:dystroglycan-type cadherin-like protein [Pseudoalteromonas sp. SR43-6]|uniref:VCBS domain-containing protein n=1 Tax=unclassified Pseudoalteromonas TaxID=194690 RepID=UPI0015FD3766|nr:MULTISPECIES: VCBS domain-containing protein [unclassified Pseudoalteromonas]MBB1289183.1 dystroglycan-type cadherin-like protein [Pseudoalteromonas sp. SR41-5]MBB1373619.1 dystroglycan-type cadherin-like protein [Pseudoalteromonas sp. SR43-6]MBB1411892.1 dystroglycan-type cadherin-like protein [Pseudoalteromonas sp. SG43-8]
MSKYTLKPCNTVTAILLSCLVTGCGSSGSDPTVQNNEAISSQTPATIAGNTLGEVISDSNDAITGSLTITDQQSGEAAFVAQENSATSYGFFSLNAGGDWSYTLDDLNASITSLSESETLQDTITVNSVDGTSAQIIITIVGAPIAQADGFEKISHVLLRSDGVNSGLGAYTLIENTFGEGSIESPDLYGGNHESVVHIIEDTDTIIGNHFVFLAHRDDDQDKDKGVSDRQRNEIKTYDKSPQETLAFEGETFQYSWKFKVSSELELTSKFSHFFQIKARNESNDNTNGNDDQPIITLSGAQKNSTGNQLQVRYSAGFDENGISTGLDKNLIETDWSLITDEWVEVFVQATFSENGKFDMTLTRLSDNAEIFNISEQNIDMWRGFSDADFARPKWGIYRSIVETNSLRADEERVRFADFSITKGKIAQ